MDDGCRCSSRFIFQVDPWPLPREVRATPDPERSPHLVAPCIAFQHVPNHLPLEDDLGGYFFRRDRQKVGCVFFSGLNDTKIDSSNGGGLIMVIYIPW